MKQTALILLLLVACSCLAQLTSAETEQHEDNVRAKRSLFGGYLYPSYGYGYGFPGYGLAYPPYGFPYYGGGYGLYKGFGYGHGFYG